VIYVVEWSSLSEHRGLVLSGEGVQDWVEYVERKVRSRRK